MIFGAIGYRVMNLTALNCPLTKWGIFVRGCNLNTLYRCVGIRIFGLLATVGPIALPYCGDIIVASSAACLHLYTLYKLDLVTTTLKSRHTTFDSTVPQSV